MQAMPTKVLVRFKTDDYQNMLLGRPIKCDDGSIVQLTIKKDWKKDLDASSTVFRRTAEVVQVGRQVEGIEVGDIAIMDYKVDNDFSIIVDEDEEGKTVSCNGVSKYYDKTTFHYANRKNGKDTVIDVEGMLETVSDILGVIRNGKILAKDPYIFMKYKPSKGIQVSGGGIIFEETFNSMELEVISSSLRSKRMYNITEGSIVSIKEADTFPVEMPNGEIYLLCNDSDVKLCKSSLKFETMDEFINTLK